MATFREGECVRNKSVDPTILPSYRPVGCALMIYSFVYHIFDPSLNIYCRDNWPYDRVEEEELAHKQQETREWFPIDRDILWNTHAANGTLKIVDVTKETLVHHVAVTASRLVAGRPLND